MIFHVNHLLLADDSHVKSSLISSPERERSGSVVVYLTRDRWVAGSSLPGNTVLCKTP